jgi:hypothetical protein
LDAMTPRMSATPKASWPWVKALLHSVYDQPDSESVHEQFDRILDALTGKLPTVAEHLDAARADVLAFTAFPKEIWRQVWSNNPNERLNREILPRKRGDPQPHRRRRHLPRPRLDHPPGRRGPGRAARRMGRSPPRPRPRRPRQRPQGPAHPRPPRGGTRHRPVRLTPEPKEPRRTQKHHSQGLDRSSTSAGRRPGRPSVTTCRGRRRRNGPRATGRRVRP